VTASNVTIDGLKIDGQGNATRGVTNVDASNGIHTVNNLIVKNSIITNITDRGVALSSDGTVYSGNLVTRNLISNFGTISGGGWGVLMIANAYADVTNNTIIDTFGGTGIQLQNCFANATTNYTGNDITVSQDGNGIFVNLFYAHRLCSTS